MDLHYAARVVQCFPSAQQEWACLDLIWRAHVADKYVKRLHKLHPLWGDGSLRAAALTDLVKWETAFMPSEMLSGIALVLSVLAQRQ